MLEAYGIAVDELAEHRHQETINGDGNDARNNSYGPLVSLPKQSTGSAIGYAAQIIEYWIKTAYYVYTYNAGSNKAHNTMQPSKAVYIWVRVA